MVYFRVFKSNVGICNMNLQICVDQSYTFVCLCYCFEDQKNINKYMKQFEYPQIFYVKEKNGIVKPKIILHFLFYF